MSAEARDLIRDYGIELVEAKCQPGANRFSLRIRFGQDIGEALPYLNAAWDAEFYDHKARVLTHDEGGRRYALRPREALVAPIEDRPDAERAAREAVEKINAVWRRRAEIAPRYEGRARPALMDLYRLLPRTNCGRCGCPSCMAFAAMLREGKARPEACAPLAEDASSPALRGLRALLPSEPAGR